ncbi:glycosyltransferase family 4 protein [Pseudoroseicyclus sp. CXY001]|uniref:glycosyltransferase family 4 protein n=1 Tax=Pseudoroseicyclus sp. CXY001 TaxID=3242492 RepID=UPI00357118BA
MTGVDRVAIEMLRALSARPDIERLTLLHPQSGDLHIEWLAQLPPEQRAKFSLQPLGRFGGYAWEQIELSRAMPQEMLLSLCTTGPVMRRSQAVLIHDAQPWDVPEAFTRRFRLAYRILLPILARRANHVMTISQFARGRLESLSIVPRGKALVVLNGADHILRNAADSEALPRLGLKAGGYLLAIGNLAPHKNLKLLAEAAAARTPGAPELIIAGGSLARVFNDTGLQARPGLRLIGRVTDGELRALCEGAQALVFPSITEGFGLPPVEAMFCGCPVIATTGGAVPEILRDAAIFVDPHDGPGWTAAMERIAADSTLRDDLRARGRKQARNYTWSAAAEALIVGLQTTG